MKTKSILLFVLLISGMDLLIVGCQCDCTDADLGTAYLCELSTINLDNSGLSPITAKDTVNKEAFGIQLDLSVSLNSLCSRRFSLFSGAYAMSDCECVTPFYSVVNRPVDIQIVTLNDFDASHPTGSDVTSYFYGFGSGDYRLARQAIRTNTVSGNEGARRNLLLLEPPTSSGSYSFKIDLVLSTSDTLTQITSNVFLK